MHTFAALLATHTLPKKVHAQLWNVSYKSISQFAESNLLDRVIVPFMENEMGTFPRGQDILMEIGAVDLLPDGPGGGDGFLHREASVPSEIGGGIAEGGFAQHQETLDIPLLDVGLLSINIDGTVEKVGDEEVMLFPKVTVSSLEDVQALDDEDIRVANHLHFLRDNVIGEVRIDGRTHQRLARLDIGQEANQAVQIVALRKAFPLHQATLLKETVWIEEPVRGDQFDLGARGPVGKQRLEQASRRAFANGHTARYPDHIGDLGSGMAEKGCSGGVQVLHCCHIEMEQAREEGRSVRPHAEKGGRSGCAGTAGALQRVSRACCRAVAPTPRG